MSSLPHHLLICFKNMSRIFNPRPTLPVPSGTCVLSGKRTFSSAFISASQAALWYLFLLAFFSYPRKSNLTAPSARAFDPSKHLTRHDMKFSRNGEVLRIRWSKTLQHREVILLIPLPLIPISDLCPVTAIHHYFQLVPADVNYPFFCVPQGRGAPTSTYNPPFLQLSQRNRHGHWPGCHELLSA